MADVRLSKKMIKIGRRQFPLVLVAVTTLAGLFLIYVVMVSVVSNKGVVLSSLDAKKASISGENERLSVEAARLQSLQVIDQNASQNVQIGDNPQTQNQNQVATPDSNATKPATVTMLPPKFVRTKEAGFLPSDGFVAVR